jgi:hypothetical protein
MPKEFTYMSEVKSLTIVAICALLVGFTIIPCYFLAVHKLNELIQMQKKVESFKYEIYKVLICAISLGLAIFLPVEIMRKYIACNSFGKYLNIYLIFLMLSSGTSLAVLAKTGKVRIKWK